MTATSAMGQREALRAGRLTLSEVNLSPTKQVGLTSGAQLPFLLIRPALPAFPVGFDLAGFPAAHRLILFQAVRSNLVAAIDLFLLLPSVQLPCSRPSWDRPVLSQIRTTIPTKSSLSE